MFLPSRTEAQAQVVNISHFLYHFVVGIEFSLLPKPFLCSASTVKMKLVAKSHLATACLGLLAFVLSICAEDPSAAVCTSAQIVTTVHII
jgi:hypothetical protein